MLKYRRTIGFMFAASIVAVCLWIWAPFGPDSDREGSAETNLQHRGESRADRTAPVNQSESSLPPGKWRSVDVSESKEIEHNRPASLNLDSPVQPLDETIDPTEQLEMPDAKPEEIQHLGEYIDPDADPSTYSGNDNPPEEQHIGEFRDPDEENSIFLDQ